MADFFAFVSEVGVYPLLVCIWLKLNAAQKSHVSMIEYLEEICPHCSNVRALLPK